MLRTACYRTLPATRGFVAPSLLGAQRRAFMRGVPAWNNLTSKRTDEEISVGTEGPHNRTQLLYGLNVSIIDRLDLVDRVSSTPVQLGQTDSKLPDEIKGDWVLFHPVYSPAELHSVEVRVGLTSILATRSAHCHARVGPSSRVEDNVR